MNFVRFLGEKEIYECSVIPVAKNVVTLLFKNEVVVNTKGFHVFLDRDCLYDLGGKNYEKFNTVYRNDEETAKYGCLQLSNDGSIYVEDGGVEKLISEKKKKIEQLKVELQSTDYIIIKAYEANLVGEVLGEYDFDNVHQERQEIRNKINILETEINALMLEREVI